MTDLGFPTSLPSHFFSTPHKKHTACGTKVKLTSGVFVFIYKCALRL